MAVFQKDNSRFNQFSTINLTDVCCTFAHNISLIHTLHAACLSTGKTFRCTFGVQNILLVVNFNTVHLLIVTSWLLVTVSSFVY